MTTSEFIKINKTGKLIQFKELIGLNKSFETALLTDFCRMAHPNCGQIAQGSTSEINTSKGHYIYTIYTTGIVQYNVTTSKRKMFYLTK